MTEHLFVSHKEFDKVYPEVKLGQRWKRCMMELSSHYNKHTGGKLVSTPKKENTKHILTPSSDNKFPSLSAKHALSHLLMSPVSFPHSNKKRLVYDFIWLFFACIPLIYQNFCIALCIQSFWFWIILMTFVYQPIIIFVYQPYTDSHLHHFIYRKEFFVHGYWPHTVLSDIYQLYTNVFLLTWIVISIMTDLYNKWIHQIYHPRGHYSKM